jgi:hypothetical protein
MSSSTVLVREAPKNQTSRNRSKIGNRAYVLLSIDEGKTEQAARALRDMPGVAIVDCLEGDPSLLVMLQAPNRLTLAESLMPLLTKVDGVTEDLRLLVSRESSVYAATSNP